MFVPFFIIVFFVQGLVFGQDEEDCYSLYPYDEVEEADGIPDAEQLALVCPEVMKYIVCEEKRSYSTQDGNELDPYIVSNKALVIDLCNNTSKLHKAYLNSIECFRSMVDEWPSCRKIGQEVYVEFYNLKNNVQVSEEDLDIEEKDEFELHEHMEPMCLITGHSLSCISIKILETCGLEAHETYVELVRRSKFMSWHCSRTTTNTLRNEFFEFLKFNKEEEQIDIFRSVFEFRKR